jgi:hypothetical protein
MFSILEKSMIAVAGPDTTRKNHHVNIVQGTAFALSFIEQFKLIIRGQSPDYTVTALQTTMWMSCKQG